MEEQKRGYTGVRKRRAQGGRAVEGGDDGGGRGGDIDGVAAAVG